MSDQYIIRGERVTYAPWDDDDGDCIKRFHDFVNDKGEVVASADFSPYAHLTDTVIRNWVARGCPSRNDTDRKWCSLDTKDFE